MIPRRRLILDAVATLRNAARRHPIDPTLEVVYTRVGSDSLIEDDLGRCAPSTRMRTPVLRDGKPVAALIHDPALARNPARLRAAVEAASLAIDNERLRAELRTRLADVQASRTRLVEAADRERRRIERNLHDGAQQRLVGLALALRLAARAAAEDPAVTALLSEAHNELDVALADLRRLARGLHPAIVTDAGLDVALETLAERPGLPVELSVDLDQRLPDAVEVAAYYVVAEALANTNKHAQATQVAVEVSVLDGTLRVTVSDDGNGGATAVPESGLEGLADRVSALGGQFHIDSPLGRGTTITADIPLDLPAPLGRSPRLLAQLRWVGWENWEIPAEIYDQLQDEDNLNFAKGTLLCAGGNGCLTEQEQDWYYAYRAVCGDADHVVEAVRAYDDSDSLEDIARMPSMGATVRGLIHDAFRLCASDGPLTDEEIGRVRDGARRMGVADDVVDAIREIVEDETALRRRRYELISGPMLSGSLGHAARRSG